MMMMMWTYDMFHFSIFHLQFFLSQDLMTFFFLLVLFLFFFVFLQDRFFLIAIAITIAITFIYSSHTNVNEIILKGKKGLEDIIFTYIGLESNVKFFFCASNLLSILCMNNFIQNITKEWCKFTTVKKATKVKGQYKVINRKQGGQVYRHLYIFLVN